MHMHVAFLILSSVPCCGVGQIGQTPLDVARRARQIKTTALLEAFLRAEPAHEVIAEAGANVRLFACFASV